MKCRVISPGSVYNLCYRLAAKILKSGYRPNVIIAIARGGFVPARFLCDFLQVSDLLSVKVQHYAAGAEKMKDVVVRYPLPPNVNLTGKNILVVDDVNDTGDSLKAALQHLSTFHPANCKVAVLHEKITTRCKADFIAFSVRHWVWIIYPWAVMEDVGSFLQKLRPPALSAEDAARRLYEQYGIRMPLGWLSRILQLIRPVAIV
jgi:hypoxanthine phosphoribosyltransferase